MSGDIFVHGDATIRGTIGGSFGTFSGRFTADTINAVQSINIRDNAVSVYYLFYPSSSTDMSIVIPPQGEDSVLFLWFSMTSMTAVNAYLQVVRNGAEIKGCWMPKEVSHVPKTMGFSDLITRSTTTSYRLWYRVVSGSLSVRMNSGVFVEIRKR